MSISFIPKLDDSTVLIVDSLNLAFRYKHSKVLEFSEDYIKTIKSFQKSYKAKHVILACDKGSSWYRRAILPEYKLNRKELFEKETEEEKLATQAFFDEYHATIDKIIEDNVFQVLQFDKVEADDIAAYIVSNKEKFKIKRIWLISSDKDWDLLVKDNVSRFSYVTRKETTVDNWLDTRDYDISDYIHIKCLTGDSGDNVPGIKQVGPKRAIDLISQYGTALDIAANIPLPGSYVYIKNINEFGADNIIRNYKLMDLLTYCEEALGVQACNIIDDVIYNTIES